MKTSLIKNHIIIYISLGWIPEICEQKKNLNIAQFMEGIAQNLVQHSLFLSYVDMYKQDIMQVSSLSWGAILRVNMLLNTLPGPPELVTKNLVQAETQMAIQ